MSTTNQICFQTATAQICITETPLSSTSNATAAGAPLSTTASLSNYIQKNSVPLALGYTLGTTTAATGGLATTSINTNGLSVVPNSNSTTANTSLGRKVISTGPTSLVSLNSAGSQTSSSGGGLSVLPTSNINPNTSLSR